ncbi:ACT domain-containing protein [Erythrobacter sp.]|jgi:hypothetical protein|uniref:ACT domain-containing protein n=1 Tax=Erythrobacter sp. TaxID=1042 RepID=UPI002ECD2C21|nr:ACT domain-containing protein [Erythrobacter sp.]
MEPGSVSDLKALLAGLDPVLDERPYAFQPIGDARFMPDTAFAMIREEEGLCCILPAAAAEEGARRFARITLRVHSDLEAVGLTPAVSTVLASSGIACNIVAGLYHDHLFVPWDRGEEALRLLKRLSLDVGR